VATAAANRLNILRTRRLRQPAIAEQISEFLKLGPQAGWGPAGRIGAVVLESPLPPKYGTNFEKWGPTENLESRNFLPCKIPLRTLRGRGIGYGGAIMPLMPAFRRRRKASAIVGRLLAGYGELEFLLAFCCVGPALASRRRPLPGHTRAIHRGRYENIAIKRIFRIRGGTDRINAAKKLIYKSFLEAGMKAEYDHTMGAMSDCLRIRNLFTHCHWGQSRKRGLFFVDLEDAAHKPGKLKITFRHADAKTLATLEDYFWHTFQWLDYLGKAYAIKTGLMLGPASSKPTKKPALMPHNRLFPHKFPH